jgi:subtilisin family serine protease
VGRGCALKRILVPVVCLLLLLAAGAVGNAAELGRTDRELPESVADLMLDSPVTIDDASLSIDPALTAAEGVVRVSVVLTQNPVASVAAAGGTARAQREQLAAVQLQQKAVAGSIDALDGETIGATQRTLNALFVEIDASQLNRLAANPNVASIHRVADYQLDLSETVPYIGATAVQSSGYNGTGVRVAVLDSGIDYTHAALGGSGVVADFTGNDPTIIEAGTFPTAKVVGGYDFVGETWAGSGDTEAPDPDPLDKGIGAGHGTHVAHIIGGVGGVAPGVSLYAVKVCSSISTACSGVALLQGMDFAIDPNGDGNLADHVDLVNMSLGSMYGSAFDDDLSQAVEHATSVGVLTVAAAGNGSDKPYVLDTPSAAPSAISVAQTAVPSAVLPLMEVTTPPAIAGTYPAVWQPWSAPLTTVIQGALQYGDGAGGNLLGCSLGADPNSVNPADQPFPAGSLTGKIVLVDRGVCNFSIKIYNIQQGGGLAGIIGLVAPGDPFEGSYGAGGPFTIPGYMISQAVSNTLKSGLGTGVTVSFDPANGIPLVGTMVGSSSRGPSMRDNLLKPEIGAPGASVSAIYGTGTGTGPFGGTSGATPMVTGAAALLMDAYPFRSPLEVKAVLMNTAETDIVNDALTGALAPISRIGGGEVRVDRALASQVAAWDNALPSGGLSFGYVDVWRETTILRKRVVVRNYGNQAVTYTVTPSFRFADDAANGAVQIQTPSSIRVSAGATRTFLVKLVIQGSLLRGNYMNSGSLGADPASLTLNEYDGYITLSSTSGSIHLPWHVLPRKSARLVGTSVLQPGSPGIAPMSLTSRQDVWSVRLINRGVGIAQDDAYALIALSPDIPEGAAGANAPVPDIAAVGVNTFPVPAGYCSAQASFIWAFAVTSHERQSHLLPVQYWFYLDTDQDGTDDYAVFNMDAALSYTDGRQVTWAMDLTTYDVTGYFYAEHATNTANTALYICGEQVGLTGTDMLSTNVDVDVEAYDYGYGGPGDWVTGLTITPFGERFYGVPDDVPGKSRGLMTVYDYGLFPGNTQELGILLFSNGDRGAGARGGATEATEALIVVPPSAEEAGED